MCRKVGCVFGFWVFLGWDGVGDFLVFNWFWGRVFGSFGYSCCFFFFWKWGACRSWYSVFSLFNSYLLGVFYMISIVLVLGDVEIRRLVFDFELFRLL